MIIKKKNQIYHATILVTRAEEWCVQANSPEEAKVLFEAGEGYRCSPGDIFHLEFGELLAP